MQGKHYYKRKLYEYYVDDELIDVGTMDELTKRNNRTEDALKNIIWLTNTGAEGKSAIHWTGAYHEAEYAYYKNDVYIMSGTVEEIAEYTGLKLKTIKWYATPSANRGYTKLERVDDEEGEAIL